MNKSNFDALLNKLDDLYLNQAKIEMSEDSTLDENTNDVSVAIVKDINSMLAPRENDINIEFSKVIERYLACAKVTKDNVVEFAKKSKTKITGVKQLVEILDQANKENDGSDAFISELLLKVKEFEKEGKERLNSPFFLLQSINHKRQQINLSRVRANEYSKLEDLLIDKNKTCVIDNECIDGNFKSVVGFAKKYGYKLEEKDNSITLSKNGNELELNNSSKILASLQAIYQIVDSNINLSKGVNEKLNEAERLFGKNVLEPEQKRINAELMNNVVKLAICENIAMMTFDSETFKQISKVLEYDMAQNLVDVAKIRNNNYIMNSIKDLIVSYSTSCYMIANYNFDSVKAKIQEVCGSVDASATNIEELLLSTKTMQLDSKFDFVKSNKYRFKNILQAKDSAKNIDNISNSIAERIKKQVNFEDGLTKDQKENLQIIKNEYEKELSRFEKFTYNDSKDMEKLVNGYIFLTALVKVIDEAMTIKEKEEDFSIEFAKNMQNLNKEASVLNIAMNFDEKTTDKNPYVTPNYTVFDPVYEQFENIDEQKQEVNTIDLSTGAPTARNVDVYTDNYVDSTDMVKETTKHEQIEVESKESKKTVETIVREKVKEVVEKKGEAEQVVNKEASKQQSIEQQKIKEYEERIRMLEEQEKALQSKLNKKQQTKDVVASVDESTKALQSRIGTFGVNIMKKSINSLAGKNIDELNVLLGFAPQETNAEVSMIKNTLNLICTNEESEEGVKNVYNMFKFMNKTQTFEDMLKLKKGMENVFIPMLSSYLAVKAKKYRYDNMSDNYLANKVLERSKLSLIEKMEDCRIAEIDALAEKFEVGSYAYNEELDQIDHKYLGEGNNIGLMGQLKNNLLTYLMKEVVSNQIDKIVECEQKQQKYVFDEENCKAELKQLFENNKVEIDELSY